MIEINPKDLTSEQATAINRALTDYYNEHPLESPLIWIDVTPPKLPWYQAISTDFILPLIAWTSMVVALTLTAVR